MELSSASYLMKNILGSTTTTAPVTTTTAASTTTTQADLLGQLIGMLTGGGGESTTTPSGVTTTTSKPDIFAIIGGILGGGQTTTPAPSTDIIQAIMNVLNGSSTELPIAEVMSLFGLTPNNPVPNPLQDPIGFLLHPLVTPILLTAITGNLPGLLLAKASLAGSIILQMIMAP